MLLKSMTGHRTTHSTFYRLGSDPIDTVALQQVH